MKELDADAGEFSAGIDLLSGGTWLLMLVLNFLSQDLRDFSDHNVKFVMMH